jgi:hypothetical protein
MQYRRLGRSGLQLSELSLGSWVTYHNQVDTGSAKEMLAAAFDAGINFFDNAEVYAGGESERVMGEAIRALRWPRLNYVISTKLYWGLDDGSASIFIFAPRVGVIIPTSPTVAIWLRAGVSRISISRDSHPFDPQTGAQLTVRETQMAAFLNEGKLADYFGPGLHRLTTANLPILTDLKNWDKAFNSPFKSDVVFFSMKEHLGLKWGTAQPITVRDAEFGAMRLRAFGTYSFRIAELEPFASRLLGTLGEVSVASLEPQLRAAIQTAIARPSRWDGADGPRSRPARSCSCCRSCRATSPDRLFSSTVD